MDLVGLPRGSGPVAGALLLEHQHRRVEPAAGAPARGARAARTCSRSRSTSSRPTRPTSPTTSCRRRASSSSTTWSPPTSTSRSRRRSRRPSRWASRCRTWRSSAASRGRWGTPSPSSTRATPSCSRPCCERSGVGEDFASLAAEGHRSDRRRAGRPVRRPPLPDPERPRRARLGSRRGRRPSPPAAPARRRPAGRWPAAPALAGLAVAPERQLRERRQDREAARARRPSPFIPTTRPSGASPRGTRPSWRTRPDACGSCVDPLGRRPARRGLLAEGALAEAGARPART